MSASAFPWLGVDIGGTKCAVCRGNPAGEIVERKAWSTPAGPAAGLAAVMQAAKELQDRHGNAEAIGVVCGGPLDTSAGRVLSPPNLPGWDDVPVVDLLSQELGAPVRLENDANAGALAEWRHGAGRGSTHLMFCTMGTGFGCGLILNGRLFAGANGNAGELGHVRLAGEGPVGYGKAGSVEGFCGGNGIARLSALRHGAWRETGNTSLLDGFDAVDAAKVAEAARAGDALALGIFREVGERLGQALAVAIDLLNPECVVIGSIFVRCESLIRPAMEAVLRREVLPDALKVCRVVPAALGERIGDVAALCVAELVTTSGCPHRGDIT